MSAAGSSDINTRSFNGLFSRCRGKVREVVPVASSETDRSRVPNGVELGGHDKVQLGGFGVRAWLGDWSVAVSRSDRPVRNG